MSDIDAEARVGRNGCPDADGLGLAFRFNRSRILVVDRLAGRAIGRLVCEDPVDRGRALQPSCRVDDVARGHSLARVRPCVERNERLARGDPDAELEPFFDREVTDRERRRTARSGSSSCAVGAPNSAITASPMNFSTVPP